MGNTRRQISIKIVKAESGSSEIVGVDCLRIFFLYERACHKLQPSRFYSFFEKRNKSQNALFKLRTIVTVLKEVVDQDMYTTRVLQSLTNALF